MVKNVDVPHRFGGTERIAGALAFVADHDGGDDHRDDGSDVRVQLSGLGRLFRLGGQATAPLPNMVGVVPGGPGAACTHTGLRAAHAKRPEGVRPACPPPGVLTPAHVVHSAAGAPNARPCGGFEHGPVRSCDSFPRSPLPSRRHTTSRNRAEAMLGSSDSLCTRPRLLGSAVGGHVMAPNPAVDLGERVCVA